MGLSFPYSHLIDAYTEVRRLKRFVKDLVIRQPKVLDYTSLDSYTPSSCGAYRPSFQMKDAGEMVKQLTIVFSPTFSSPKIQMSDILKTTALLLSE